MIFSLLINLQGGRFDRFVAAIPAAAFAGRQLGRRKEGLPCRVFAPHQFGAGPPEIARLHCKLMMKKKTKQTLTNL